LTGRELTETKENLGKSLRFENSASGASASLEYEATVNQSFPKTDLTVFSANEIHLSSSHRVIMRVPDRSFIDQQPE
jgi:hypothetical protein